MRAPFSDSACAPPVTVMPHPLPTASNTPRGSNAADSPLGANDVPGGCLMRAGCARDGAAARR